MVVLKEFCPDSENGLCFGKFFESPSNSVEAPPTLLAHFFEKSFSSLDRGKFAAIRCCLTSLYIISIGFGKTLKILVFPRSLHFALDAFKEQVFQSDF